MKPVNEAQMQVLDGYAAAFYESEDYSTELWMQLIEDSCGTFCQDTGVERNTHELAMAYIEWRTKKEEKEDV
jgi:hypothetical protein